MTTKRITQWLGLVMVFTMLVAVTGGSGAVKAQQDTFNPDGTVSDASQPMNHVETTLAFPKSGIGYDSGWMVINPGQTLTLTHNIGGTADDYLVDLRFYGSTYNYNQAMYGGNDFINPAPVGYAVNDQVGGYWHNLTNSTIKVTRRPNDNSFMVKFRLRIWVDNGYVYNSGWRSAALDFLTNFSFSLTDAVEDYLVYMDFFDSAVGGFGVNQVSYGGKTNKDNERIGAYWRNFTTSGIGVYRRAEDIYADQVRVRIFKNPKPTYDSGWVNLTLNIFTPLLHNIGGNPDDYVVDMEFKDTAAGGGADNGMGINQRCYGGCDYRTVDSFPNTKQGAFWAFLTNNSISVGRRPGDLFADQVRVRIWHFAKLPRPAFDSGWKSAAAGSGYINYHRLGGNVDDYMVFLTFKDPLYKVHQIYYGSAQFGTKVPDGYAENEIAGGWWHDLNSNSISIHRAANDHQVPEYRVVIFKMPKPDYDSGWVTVAQDLAYNHNHSLGGLVTDYLVDLTCKTSGGDINQQYYGSQHLADNSRVGAYYWGLKTTNVMVYRQTNDTFCETHRLRIWRMAPPAYTSGYFSIAQDGYVDKNHNLGFSTDNYLVDVTAHNDNGDHKMFYGRTDYGTKPQGFQSENDRVGYMWYSLNTATIRTYRLKEDLYAQSVNVRIWTIPTTIFLPITMK